MKLQFDSIERLLEYANKPVPSFVNEGSRAIGKYKTEFTGCETYEDAIRITREGVNLETIQTGIESLSQQGCEIQTTYAVCGAYVCMGTYLSGEPECMITFQENESVKFAELIVDTSENAGVGAETFKNKVIVSASIVDRLESMGYRVKVRVVCDSTDSGGIGNLSIDVCVKDYKENLSIAQLSGCINQTFFRRIIFSVIERAYAENGKDASDYGYGRAKQNYSEYGNDCLIVKSHSAGGVRYSGDLNKIVNDIITEYESRH